MFERKFPYIEPRIRVYPSVSAVEDEMEEYGFLYPGLEPLTPVTSLLEESKTFVIGEPGLGKTELLKRIQAAASDSGLFAFYITLKSIQHRSLIQYSEQTYEQMAGRRPQSDDPFTMCLDGLDEVSGEYFPSVADQIKGLAAAYPSAKLYVASRRHFFRKYQILFLGEGFIYANILPLQRSDVRQYLLESGFSNADCEQIIGSFHLPGRDLVIQVPRYLALLAQYVHDKGMRNLDALTRSELFDYFIYHKLSIEELRDYRISRDLVKRVLQKLALIMEMYQVTLLTKNELMTFFDDINSDLKRVFLQQVPMTFFYSNSLLKDNDTSVEFENVEFQEYLAACEICELGPLTQVVYDLAIDPEIRQIYPSWYNTLGYILDQDASILGPILDLARFSTYSGSIDEEYYRLIGRISPSRLDEPTRKVLFENVVGYYQESLHWINRDTARGLSYLSHPDQQAYLRTYCDQASFASETHRFVQCGNVATLIGHLLRRRAIRDVDQPYWRSKLIEFALDANPNGVLQRNALAALADLGDPSVIEDVEPVRTSPDKLIRDRFIHLLTALAPDAPLSLGYFFDGTKAGQIAAKDALYHLTDKESLKDFLRSLANDETLAYQFLDSERVSRDKSLETVENIDNVWDPEFEELVTHLIVATLSSMHPYVVRRSSFLSALVRLADSKQARYLFRLVSAVMSLPNSLRTLFELDALLACLLRAEYVSDFITALAPVDQDHSITFHILRQVKNSDRSDADEVYEEGRTTLSDLYDKAETRQRSSPVSPSQEERVLSKFRNALEPEPGMYQPSVFATYIAHRDMLEQVMSGKEKEQLVSLVTTVVFDQIDPATTIFQITERAGGGVMYTTSPGIWLFGECIIVAHFLGINPGPHRQKIIDYIPFANMEQLQAIFAIIPTIMSEELRNVMTIYEQRDSDVWRYSPDSFSQATAHYKVVAAVPMLRTLAASDILSEWERKNALTAAEALLPDKDYLLSIFREARSTCLPLAEDANGLLITGHADLAAVRWRMEEVKARAFTFIEPEGVHGVSVSEDELREMKFASPLLKLSDPSLVSLYLDLLDRSLGLLPADTAYLHYARYVWKIVRAYFDNLKQTGTYTYLRELEQHMALLSGNEGANWFDYEIVELKRSYINYLGKPNTVNDCIKVYNELKTKQYLAIRDEYQLVEMVKQFFSESVRTWVQDEGKDIIAKCLVPRLKAEKELQKIFGLHLKTIAFQKGFRPNEVTPLKEPELLDGTKTDFLIHYGLMRPVVIEIKLSDHKDIKGKGKLETRESYASYQGYRSNYNAAGSLFVVLDVRKDRPNGDSWASQLTRIRSAYESGTSYVVGIELTQI